MQIRTRNNLLEWLERNAPYPCIKRALLEGKVEVLGGFKQVPPSVRPGWIVKITSKFNRIWYVAVKIQPQEKYKTYVLEKVPWKFWIGDESNNPLYQGDLSEKYKRLKNKELENA